MIDYEQKYYDEVYKNKKLIDENDKLKELLNIYKILLKDKPLNKIIAEELIGYLKKDSD